MAVSNLAAIYNALSQFYQPQLARQWNRKVVLLPYLKVKTDYGKNVAWDISVSGQTAATYTEGADVESTEYLIDTKLPMILQWANYRNAFAFSELQLQAAMQSRGSADQLINLLGESVFESAAALASKLNQDLYTGAGSGNAMCGLDYALLASGLYAGQNVGTYTELKSTLDTNSNVNRALTFELMSKMEGQIYKKSGMRPNLIVTTPEVMVKYKSLFEPIRRVQGDSVSRFDTSVQDDGLYFAGVKVVRDKDCPAGCMYFLNTDAMHMAVLPPSNFGDSAKFELKNAVGSNGIEEEATGIPLSMQALAKTGDSVKFFLKTHLNLVVTRPNALGKVSFIAE